MSDLYQSLEDKKFDKRLIDFNKSEKLIDEDQVKKNLEALEDLSEQCEKIKLSDDNEEGIH